LPLVSNGDALERIAGAQERLAAAAEETASLLRSLVRQVDRQERYLDLVVTQGQFNVRETAEAAAAGKMYLQHIWGTAEFKSRWSNWREAFDKHVGQYTAVSSLQREAAERESMDKGEGTSKGKGKGKAREVVEEDTLDADGEEAESEGEDEDEDIEEME
jgi:hypothetical protein